MRNLAYLIEILNVILKDKERSNKQRIQKYLCCVILTRFDDIAKDYKSLNGYKHLQDMNTFLGFVFGVDVHTMQYILHKLHAYKNINNKDIQTCLNIKL